MRLRSSIGPTLDIRSFGRFKVAYRSGTTDEDVLGHSFDRDIFFTGAPEYTPAKDHVIIDVGAHIGTFSLLAASKVPQGQVYAIEASKESFELLRFNAALNHFANVDVTHLALADTRRICTLYHDTGNWGHTIVTPLSSLGETVRTDSLANFLNQKEISRCNFMKMNCEGAEFPILLTAPASVLRRFDMMLVLYHSALYDQHSVEDLKTHLRDSGFELTVRKEREKGGWIIAKNSMYT